MNETQEDNDSLKTSIQDPEEDGNVNIEENQKPQILIKIQQDLENTRHMRKKSVGEPLIRDHQKDVRIHSRNILSRTINRRGTASTAPNKIIP